MSNRKIIIVVVLITLIALSLWLIFRKPVTKTIEGKTAPIIKFPLKFGSSGYGVSQVQKYLNQKYSAGLRVDGDWGSNTNNAALLYLKRDNVSEDVFYKWELDKI